MAGKVELLCWCKRNKKSGGCMGGWMGGWMGVKAVLRIAYSNQKLFQIIF